MGYSCKHACVTGGAGFIGSHVVGALLARGTEVTVLDNLSVGRESNVPRGARLIVGDVLDRAKVQEAIAGCDAVLHLAAKVAIRSSFEFVVEDATTNYVGTANVLRAVQQSNSVRKVIATSSMAVYADGPGPVPIDERYDTRPISPYGISKLAAENLTHAMCGAAGVESVVLRLFNTYGPGQALSPYVGVVTIFVNKLLNGEIPVIFGDGEQCRDFVHVEDVARGFVAALESDVSNETFNIGTGRPVSVNSVFQALQAALEAPTEAEHVPAVAGELRYSVANIAKAQHLLGYQPMHRFESSINPVAQEIRATQPNNAVPSLVKATRS